MKIKSVIASIIIFITSNITFSQANDTSPCSSPEASQFDFWIGEWNLTWKSAEGKEQTGSNTIIKSLSGCVIEEHFDGNPSMQFIGKSFSVYNPQKNTWQQTWVDNSGGYMVFEGGMDSNRMILSREIQGKDGKPIIQRMVFYNIKKNSLDWDWEASRDAGKTWKLNWRLHYKRRS